MSESEERYSLELANICATVDIKELKLLGGFDHPNIVRFVSFFCLIATQAEGAFS